MAANTDTVEILRDAEATLHEGWNQRERRELLMSSATPTDFIT